LSPLFIAATALAIGLVLRRLIAQVLLNDGTFLVIILPCGCGTANCVKTLSRRPGKHLTIF
jgi:hypothetical protein